MGAYLCVVVLLVAATPHPDPPTILTKSKAFCRLDIILHSGIGLVSSSVVVSIPSTCSHADPHQCQHSSNVTVCYGDHVYEWCEFNQLGCAGKLANITSVSDKVNHSLCAAILVVRPPAPTTTAAPLSHFEVRFYLSAIHGIDDLLHKALSSNHSLDEIRNIYTTQDHAHRHYVRNVNCWAYPLDLTSISPWNSKGHTRRAGTLVTPRHLVWARHYSMPVNTTVRFIDRNNNIVDRTITRTKAVPSGAGSFLSGSDIVVGELDHDVASGISPAKVMPKNLSAIRPPHNVHVPVFDTDFEEKALIANLLYENGKMVGLTVPPATSIRRQFFEPKITGDSGNPVFVIINNEPVLMFMFTYGGAGSGTSVTYHYDDINNIIASWGSSYRLTDVDLTSFLDDGSAIPQVIG